MPFVYQTLALCFVFALSEDLPWVITPRIVLSAPPQLFGWGLPPSSVPKESACNVGDPSSIPIGKIPWGRKWQPTPIFQPRKSHGGGVWQATVHEVTRVRYNLSTKPPPPPQLFSTSLHKYPGFTGGSESKQSACNAGEPGSISGLGRSPGEGNGHPPHYSAAWWAAVHVPKSRTWLRN